jgi:hypothetical protein
MRTVGLWFVAIVVAGTALRFARLGHHSLWYDEVMAIDQTKQPVTRMHAPAYSLLLRGWITLFGTGAIAARSLSALCGVASLFVFHALARQWATGTAALLSTGLLAISPAHIYYSQEAEPFALVVLLVMSTAWLATRRQWVWAAIAGIATALAFGHIRGESTRWFAQLAATPIFLVAGRTFVWKHLNGWVALAGIALVALAAIPPLVGSLRTRPWRPLLWSVIPVLLVLILCPYIAHYGLVALPAFLILAGIGLTTLPRVMAWVCGALLAGICLVSLGNYYFSAIKPEWNKAAAFVKAATGDLALFDADFNQSTFLYYFHAPLNTLRLNPRPTGTTFSATTGRGKPWGDHTATVNAASRVWLVLADPAGGDAYPRLLDAGRSRLREKQFAGITVILYGPRR